VQSALKDRTSTTGHEKISAEVFARSWTNSTDQERILLVHAVAALIPAISHERELTKSAPLGEDREMVQCPVSCRRFSRDKPSTELIERAQQNEGANAILSILLARDCVCSKCLVIANPERFTDIFSTVMEALGLESAE